MLVFATPILFMFFVFWPLKSDMYTFWARFAFHVDLQAILIKLDFKKKETRCLFLQLLAILVSLEFFYIMYLRPCNSFKINSLESNMTQEELERESVNTLLKTKELQCGLIAVLVLLAKLYPRFFFDGYLYDLHYLSGGLWSID